MKFKIHLLKQFELVINKTNNVFYVVILYLLVNLGFFITGNTHVFIWILWKSLIVCIKKVKYLQNVKKTQR